MQSDAIFIVEKPKNINKILGNESNADLEILQESLEPSAFQFCNSKSVELFKFKLTDHQTSIDKQIILNKLNAKRFAH